MDSKVNGEALLDDSVVEMEANAAVEAGFDGANGDGLKASSSAFAESSAITMMNLRTEIAELKAEITKINGAMKEFCVDAQNFRHEMESHWRAQSDKNKQLHTEIARLCNENMSLRSKKDLDQRAFTKLENKVGQMKNEDKKLKNWHIEEIVAIKVNLTAATELVTVNRADIKELKKTHVESKGANALNLIRTDIKELKSAYEDSQSTHALHSEILKDYQSNSDRLRPEASFLYTIYNIKNLKSRYVSTPFYVRNIPWFLRVEPDGDFLAVYISCKCEDEDESWCCFATYDVRLKCSNPSLKLNAFKHSNWFTEKDKFWGWGEFIKWQVLINPQNGYLQNNSITFEVNLKAKKTNSITTSCVSKK